MPLPHSAAMQNRLVAVVVTCIVAAALAVAAAVGMAAALEAKPDQPNDPLVTFENR
jgi:hypothetical protein